MAEIVDILTVPLAETMKFTVNLAGDYVAAVPGDPTYANNWLFGLHGAVFQKGDCFNIISLGFAMPESFTLWKRTGIDSRLEFWGGFPSP